MMRNNEIPAWTWLKAHPRATYSALALIAALWLALALAGCGQVATGTPIAPAAAQQTAQAVSPVTILKKMGVPTRAVYGDRDIYGDRYASGDFASGENVTVYTFADAAAQQESNARNSAAGYGYSTDTNVQIRGPVWDALVTAAGSWSSDGNIVSTFPVSPAVLAHRAGGTVVPGQKL